MAAPVDAAVVAESREAEPAAEQEPPTKGIEPPPPPSSEPVPPGPDDVPPTHFEGREIAQTMSFLGAGWLTRSERDAEEDTTLLHRALHLRPGQTACDVGAGSGYHTVRMARAVGPTGRVLAVDVQPQMLEMLRARVEKEGLRNVETIEGRPGDPRLPKGACDLILLVDVYHELSWPEPMLAAFRRALSPQGRLVLAEFRAEDPKVPIKKLHKMSKAQVERELSPRGFALVESFDELPWQHLLFYSSRDDAKPPTPTLAPSTPTIASLCEGLCVQRNQMRAVGPEVIEADCRSSCADIEGAAANPACATTAKEYRAKLEAKPMKDRARHFWTLLSDPALSCGTSDPTLDGLSAAWRDPDPSRRIDAMRAVLVADPWIEHSCPAGAEALSDPAAMRSVDALVERCPIAGATVGAPIHRDLDPVTFLAIQTVRMRWRALGATSGDHDILLNTVLLSTALGNE